MCNVRSKGKGSPKGRGNVPSHRCIHLNLNGTWGGFAPTHPVPGLRLSPR
jgi:hypothetical protein